MSVIKHELRNVWLRVRQVSGARRQLSVYSIQEWPDRGFATLPELGSEMETSTAECWASARAAALLAVSERATTHCS